MESSVSARASAVSFSDQPIKAFLGLKKRQFKQKSFYRQKARDFLESRGAIVADVQCYIKSRARGKPQVDPNVVNLFLRLNGQNSIDIIT